MIDNFGEFTSYFSFAWDSFTHLSESIKSLVDSVMIWFDVDDEETVSLQRMTDISLLSNITDFTHLYVSHDINADIVGFAEHKYAIDDYYTSYLLEYSDFSTDICDFVSKYNENILDASSFIECDDLGNDDYLLYVRNYGDFPIWADLTAKLRLA